MNHPALSDEQIVEIVREKDMELYGEIIRRYQAKLSHYLRKFINNSAELEDVLQDVFIKAYKNLYGFNTKQKFSSWIYRIAHNEAINSIKKRAHEYLFLDEEEFDIIDKKIDFVSGLDAALARRAIEKCLAQMDDKYREPLILFFFEEKTYEEIGDILKMPTSTVGTLLLRGKRILKEFLEKEQYGR